MRGALIIALVVPLAGCLAPDYFDYGAYKRSLLPEAGPEDAVVDAAGDSGQPDGSVDGGPDGGQEGGMDAAPPSPQPPAPMDAGKPDVCEFETCGGVERFLGDFEIPSPYYLGPEVPLQLVPGMELHFESTGTWNVSLAGGTAAPKVEVDADGVPADGGDPVECEPGENLGICPLPDSNKGMVYVQVGSQRSEVGKARVVPVTAAAGLFMIAANVWMGPENNVGQMQVKAWVTYAVECVDVQTASLHCGACDNACEPGQTCVEGGCE